MLVGALIYSFFPLFLFSCLYQIYAFLIIIFSLACCSSIKLWALTGEVLMEMVGHTSIVYSVDSHVSGLIVSSSEDCFAKIWKGDCF